MNWAALRPTTFAQPGRGREPNEGHGGAALLAVVGHPPRGAFHQKHV